MVRLSCMVSQLLLKPNSIVAQMPAWKDQFLSNAELVISFMNKISVCTHAYTHINILRTLWLVTILEANDKPFIHMMHHHLYM